MKNLLKAIWKKEIKSILGNKRVVGIYAALVIGVPLLSLYSLSNAMSQAPEPFREETLKIFSNFFLLFYSIPLILFLAHSTFSEVFYQEKYSGALPTLLASPVTLRDITIGKALAIFTLAYPLTLLGASVFLLSVQLLYPEWCYSFLETYTILHLFTSLPLLGFGVVFPIGTLILICKNVMGINLISFMVIMILMFSGKNIQEAVKSTQSLYFYVLTIAFITLLSGYVINRRTHMERVIA